jgi:hypothetical protein
MLLQFFYTSGEIDTTDTNLALLTLFEPSSTFRLDPSRQIEL